MLARQDMDEQALLLASKSGETGAFNYLVQHYQVQIYNLALRMLGDPAAAEDISQETFVSAFRKLHTFHEGNFRAWLFRIASNACRDQLRSARVRHNTSLDAMLEGATLNPRSQAESPESFALRKELARKLQEGISGLPDDQRLVLLLVDLQGLSYEEAGEILKTPIGTVKSRLSRARGAMRIFLMSNRELLPSQFRSLTVGD